MDPLWTTAIPLLTMISGGLFVYIVMRNRRRPAVAGSERSETDKLFHLGFERSPIGMAYLASDGSWLYANARLIQMLGYERAEFNRTSLRMLTHSEDRKREAGMMAAVRSGRSRGFTLNKRLRKADGTYETFRFSIARIGGGVGVVFQCIIDEAPSEAVGHGDLAAALENVPEISVIELDSQGMITSWNRGAKELFGYTADEMTGRPWTRLHTVERGKAGEANRELATAASNGRFEGRDSRKRSDDAIVSVDIVIIPRFRGRDLVGFVEISRDSSLSFSAREYRTAYERLKHLDEDKIEQLGQSNDRMRQELERHAGMEVSMREAYEKLRASNREMNGRVRILSAALRKLIDQRKNLEETIRSSRADRSESEELVASLPSTLDWQRMTRSPQEALSRIARAGSDGVAVFRSGEQEKRFTIRSGMIASCSSNSPELLFGQLLVSAGELSESDRRKMIDVQEQTGIAFGRLLLLFELLPEDRIRDGMRTKIERELEDLANWSDGECAFFQSDVEIMQIIPVEVPIEHPEADDSDEMEVAGSETDPTGTVVTEVSEEGEAIDEVLELVASSKAKKFHREECSFAKRIPKRSRIRLGSRSDAEARGLKPCRTCLSDQGIFR